MLMHLLLRGYLFIATGNPDMCQLTCSSVWSPRNIPSLLIRSREKSKRR